jgi:TonB family protein
MNRGHSWRTLWLGGLIVLAATTAVAGDDSLATARDLYAAASYEDALAVLNRLGTPAGVSGDGRAIGQYRAFCLLALGRVTEAEHAIEVLVAAEPSFHPSDADASPRIRSAFSDVRRRMLPVIVQQQYAQAKAAYDRKEFGVAADGFKQVIGVLNDPDLRSAANQAPLSDLRTLAAGFSELSASAAAPPPPPLASAPMVLPETPQLTGLASPAGLASAAGPKSPQTTQITQNPETPPPQRVYGAEDGNVVQPSVVRQTLPPFPASALSRGRGTLAVLIDESGSVETASMVGSLGTAYDAAVLSAARQWRYKAATLDGVPVKYRRIVQINLVPSK